MPSNRIQFMSPYRARRFRVAVKWQGAGRQQAMVTPRRSTSNHQPCKHHGRHYCRVSTASIDTGHRETRGRSRNTASPLRRPAPSPPAQLALN